MNRIREKQTTRKKKALLYLITDPELTGENKLLKIVEESAREGVDIIQVRDDRGPDAKFLNLAKEVVRVAHGENTMVLIYDRFDIALAAGADGVHFGKESMPVHTVRKNVDKDLVYGVSAKSRQDLRKAQRDGVDFVTYHPVFKTKDPDSPEPKGVKMLEENARSFDLPIFAMGGVNLSNFHMLSDTGVTGIAVISAISNSKTISYTVEQFREGLRDFN